MNKNLINPEQLSDYLPDKPTIGTIYQWVHHKKIPFVKKGKKLFFDKTEIDNWDENNRPETIKAAL